MQKRDGHAFKAIAYSFRQSGREGGLVQRPHDLASRSQPLVGFHNAGEQWWRPLEVQVE